MAHFETFLIIVSPRLGVWKKERGIRGSPLDFLCLEAAYSI